MVKYKFSSFNDLKKVYGNASIVNNQRIVFNIKENDYRLVVSVISEEMLVTQFGLVRINSMIKLM
ncbi:type II toxin-antitoxin system HigB family toxin [Pelobium manganitolerans]|uniref:type II toxin-antitoxin system HigB family toxin n=1 Tax=Pelobium manganitolerans TaxID=1842495 RepID=UPI003FA371A9